MRGFWLIPALLAAAVVYACFDWESGVPAWFRLSGELQQAHERIERLRVEIDELRGQSVALRDDPFAIERAIREDLRLARPGELMVRFLPAPGSNPRFP